MASAERMNELELYVEYWEGALKAVTDIRDRLLKDQENGFSLSDEEGNNVLPDRIAIVDKAVIDHDKYLTYMRSLRDRAAGGENV